MWNGRVSLRQCMIVLILLVTLTPFAVHSVITVRNLQSSSLAEAQRKLASQAFDDNAMLAAKADAYGSLLKLLATSPNIYDYKSFKNYGLLMKLQLQEIVATHPEFSNIMIVTSDNEHFYYREPSAATGDDAGTDGYRNAAERPKEVIWDEQAKHDETTDSWIKTFRMGYLSESPEPKAAGVVTVSLKIDSFSADLRKRSDTDGLLRLIVSDDGQIVASSDLGAVGSAFPFGNADLGNANGFREIPFGKETYYGSMTEVTDLHLRSVVLETKSAALSQANRILRLNLLTLGIIGAVYIVLAVLLAGWISRPITEIAGAMENMSRHDLTAGGLRNFRGRMGRIKEFGDLKRNFVLLQENYRELIASIMQTARELTNYSEQLKEHARKNAEALTESSLGIAEISKGAEEHAAMSEKGLTIGITLSGHLAANRSSFDDLMDKLGELSRLTNRTGQSLEQALIHAEESQAVTSDVIDSVSEFLRSLKMIDQVLETIGGISSQTNILALNASIEASRAGAAGKGFAVIAGQIKDLTFQGQQAASRISDVIESLDRSSRGIMSRIKELMLASEKQHRMAGESRLVHLQHSAIYDEVVGTIGRVKGQTDDMDGSMANLAVMMHDTASVSQETSALTEQLTAKLEWQADSSRELLDASVRMQELTESLDRITSKFKLS